MTPGDEPGADPGRTDDVDYSFEPWGLTWVFLESSSGDVEEFGEKLVGHLAMCAGVPCAP